jgi:hypothetical protein
MSTTPTPEELKKESYYHRQMREFADKMNPGETQIKYEKNFREANLFYKNYEGETISFPLEWSDKDCLKRILENMDPSLEMIRKLFMQGNIYVHKDGYRDDKILRKWADSMCALEGLRDTIKSHLSKDDLVITSEPAKSNYEKYLKNIGENNITTKSLTEKELAIRLRISLPKLRADRQRGIGIPYVKHGKSVRYNLDDVYQYLEENKYPKKEKTI